MEVGEKGVAQICLNLAFKDRLTIRSSEGLKALGTFTWNYDKAKAFLHGVISESVVLILENHLRLQYDCYGDR